MLVIVLVSWLCCFYRICRCWCRVCWLRVVVVMSGRLVWLCGWFWLVFGLLLRWLVRCWCIGNWVLLWLLRVWMNLILGSLRVICCCWKVWFLIVILISGWRGCVVMVCRYWYWFCIVLVCWRWWCVCVKLGIGWYVRWLKGLMWSGCVRWFGVWNWWLCRYWVRMNGCWSCVLVRVFWCWCWISLIVCNVNVCVIWLNCWWYWLDLNVIVVSVKMIWLRKLSCIGNCVLLLDVCVCCWKMCCKSWCVLRGFCWCKYSWLGWGWFKFGVVFCIGFCLVFVCELMC